MNEGEKEYAYLQPKQEEESGKGQLEIGYEDSKREDLDEQNDANMDKNQDNTTSGKYILKDGKLVKGSAEKRETVDFSNWYAGNVDPEDLRRHKELLDRQHFGGPIWAGKKLPKSIIEELNDPNIKFAEGEGQVNPNILDPKDIDSQFEKVRR